GIRGGSAEAAGREFGGERGVSKKPLLHAARTNMVDIIADECLRALLSKLTEVTVIYDADDNPIGVFKPWAIAEREMYERAKKLFDPVEMERRAQSKEKGYTIEEVMRHLESLESAE